MMKMENEIRNKRIRAIAELMVKADKDKVTEEEFHAEFDRLYEGMPPSTHLRVMSLYRQMVGDTSGHSMMMAMTPDGPFLVEEPLQWDAPEVPAYHVKPDEKA